jgi:hypothetical protein
MDARPSRFEIGILLICNMAAVVNDKEGTPVDAQAVHQCESSTSENSRQLGTASNIARLQAKVLANCAWVEHQAACALLRISASDTSTSAEAKSLFGDILRVMVDGRLVYPLFQFDVEGHRVLPTMVKIHNAKPTGWSDYRLLYWLTTPHSDLGCTPAEALSSAGSAVLSAFGRAIQTPSHG